MSQQNLLPPFENSLGEELGEVRVETPGIIVIGKIVSGVEAFSGPSSLKVTIDRAYSNFTTA